MYIVQIEFRYMGEPIYKDHGTHKDKTITVGIYDTIEDAVESGNNALLEFEKRFKLNPNPRRTTSRFSVNMRSKLITHLGYILGAPFQFFAKITKLDFSDVGDTIEEVLESDKKYRKWKSENDDN